MNHIINLNNYTFNGVNYLQVKGCAMGTTAAPSHATIFMGRFEENFIYPHILADCFLYCRVIEDIFRIYTLPEASSSNFIVDLNTRHESIKFDYKISETQIAFLDTVVYSNMNRQMLYL